MNYGNNIVANNNHRNNNNNNNSNNNYRARNNRFNRFPAKSNPQPTMKVPIMGVKNPEYATDAMNASTTLVNSIKQSWLSGNHHDRISPSESPLNEYNYSPVHQQQIWPTKFNEWDKSPGKSLDMQPYPKFIPTLNGYPYAGGPTSSPSPVGSSRCSIYSNSSPPQVISGGSSPMTSNYFPIGMSNGRRCSAEEMLRSRSPDEIQINFHDIARASSSLSPDEPNYKFKPIGSNRNVESRLSDDANYGGYYPTCRSSESRSSEDLSLENIIDEFRIRSPDSGIASEAKRNSTTSNDSGKCIECTMERICDNCADTYPQSMKANVGSPTQDGTVQFVKDLTSAMTSVLDMGPYSQKMTTMISNQLSLPSNNQMTKAMVPTNRQINIVKHMPFPSHGQLIVPTAADDQPLASSSPVFFQNSRSQSDKPVHYCTIHSTAQRFYCQTCSKLFCNECVPQQHVGHLMVHILDATESAQKQAEQVINECRSTMDSIRGDIQNGVMTAQKLNLAANDAVEAVRDLTRRITEAWRIRESELIASIQASRQSKQASVRSRDEGLKQGLCHLEQTIGQLNRYIDSSSLTSNPADLFMQKDRATGELFRVKSQRNNLPPPEEHSIRFQAMPPDNHVIDSIRTIGSIMTGNGHIGDRRLLPRPAIQSAGPPPPVPRSRAIAGATHKVSIVNNRHSLDGNAIISIGDNSTVEENLCRPWGVACDREGHFVIADRSNNRIQIFRANGSFVRRFGCHGTGDGQFDRPAGIAVDARRRIIVADKDNHRMQILTMDGEFLLKFGMKGPEPGNFNYPWDVATNDACQIVVSDTRNHRIQMFSPEGVFLRKFGFETQPQLWKCLDSPRGVAFTNEGNVLVTDFNNHRIVVVDADFMSARFLGCDSLSPHPMPPKTFMRPQGIAVDDAGHIIVCDSRNHRVQILDANGVCRGKFGELGNGKDQMDRPSGVAVTPDGKIVVVDFGNNRVLVF